MSQTIVFATPFTFHAPVPLATTLLCWGNGDPEGFRDAAAEMRLPLTVVTDAAVAWVGSNYRTSLT